MTVDIRERYCQTVDLGFGRHRHLARVEVETARDALHPRDGLVIVKHIVEAEHGHGVRHGREGIFRRGANGNLRREFGVLLFERSETTHERVVVTIGNDRFVAQVIRRVVLRDFFAQCGYFVAWIHRATTVAAPITVSPTSRS